jgi:hypothetical protein
MATRLGRVKQQQWQAAWQSPQPQDEPTTKLFQSLTSLKIEVRLLGSTPANRRGRAVSRCGSTVSVDLNPTLSQR